MHYDDLSKDFGETIAAKIREWLEENPGVDVEELLTPFLPTGEESTLQLDETTLFLRFLAVECFNAHPDRSVDDFLSMSTGGVFISQWAEEHDMDPQVLLKGLRAAPEQD